MCVCVSNSINNMLNIKYNSTISILIKRLYYIISSCSFTVTNKTNKFGWEVSRIWNN